MGMQGKRDARRRFRFSLRALLMFAVCLCFVFAYIGWGIRQKSDRISHDEFLDGVSLAKLVRQIDPQAQIEYGGGPSQAGGYLGATATHEEGFGIRGSSLGTADLIKGIVTQFEKQLATAGAHDVDIDQLSSIGMSVGTRIVFKLRGADGVMTIRATEVNNKHFDVYLTSNIVLIR